MKLANSGCGSKGRDFSSGWNCTPMNQGWSGSSMISGSRPSGDRPAEAHAGLLQPLAVVGVDLVAVAVALGDLRARRRSWPPGCPWPARPDRRRAAWCRRDRRLSRRFSSSLPRIHSVIRPTTGSVARPELGGAGLGDADQVARRLDHRHLHAEADAEVGHAARAREAGRQDLALRAALAEAAGHQDAVHVLQVGRGVLALEHLALDPLELHLHAGWRCRRGTAPR